MKITATRISIFLMSVLCLILFWVSGNSERGGSIPSGTYPLADHESVFANEGSPQTSRSGSFTEGMDSPLLIKEVTFTANLNARARVFLMQALGAEYVASSGRNRIVVRIPVSRLAEAEACSGVLTTGSPRPRIEEFAPGKNRTATICYYQGEQRSVEARLSRSGIRVLNRVPELNAMVVHGSQKALLSLEDFSSIESVSNPGEIGVTNEDVAFLSGVDLVRDGSVLGGPLGGEGITVGIWDSGNVDSDHPDLVGRVQNMGDFSYFESAHATHVTGTILGSGENDFRAMGMAPEAKLRVWSFKVGTVQTIKEWMTKTAEYDVANNSWGKVNGWRSINGVPWWYGGANPNQEDSMFGRYSVESRIVDQATKCDARIVVVGAGNDRNDVGGGVHYHFEDGGLFPHMCAHPADGRDDDDPLGMVDGMDTLTPISVAKNPIVVGAVTKEGAMTSFSSWGPTDDGRIKPDIVAGGADVFSTFPSHLGLYGSLSGTSMAAPVVSGSIALLLERMETSGYSFGKNARLSLVKALLIHTAGDLDTPGPDYKTGWGLLDTKAALDHVEKDIMEGKLSRMKVSSLNDGETLSATFYAEEGEPLQVTIAWSDIAGPSVVALPTDDPGEGALMNDLDLELFGPGGEKVSGVWNLDPAQPLLPATRDGESNHRDNVEQIRVDAAPVTGWYTIQISHKGVLVGITSGTDFQAFSLMASHPVSPFSVQGVELIGDLTGDGLVNVVDIQKVISVVHNLIPVSPELFAKADLTKDGLVDVMDVVFLYYLIVEGEE